MTLKKVLYNVGTWFRLWRMHLQQSSPHLYNSTSNKSWTHMSPVPDRRTMSAGTAYRVGLGVHSWLHDTQHNDTQHNETQHNDSQHEALFLTLSITTPYQVLICWVSLFIYFNVMLNVVCWGSLMQSVGHMSDGQMSDGQMSDGQMSDGQMPVV